VRRSIDLASQIISGMTHRTPGDRHSARSASASGGFTLIELMIAVVVLGILVSIAFPSFMDSIRKGRRSEAMAALSFAQQSQERWRGNNANYTVTLASLGVTTPTPTGYYDITIAAPEAPGTLANGYMVIATGRSGTSQANDTECKKMGVQVIGGNVTYGGCGACADLTFANTNKCWNR
jgi:type IV pilus assembly protein PilE